MKNSCLCLLLFFSLTAVAQDYTREGNEVKPREPVLFVPGSAKLLPESDKALNAIKAYLDKSSYISLMRVEGHTAADGGSEQKNQALSEQRALAVCKRLVELGVDCKRLVAVGFGGQKPIADNSTAEGKNANRRISFLNAALRNTLIGGMPADGGGQAVANVCAE